MTPDEHATEAPLRVENSSTRIDHEAIHGSRGPLPSGKVHVDLPGGMFAAPNVEIPRLRPRPAMPHGQHSASTRHPLLSVFFASSKLALFFLIAWGLLFNFSEVRGSSMEPGIKDRDRILVDHVSYMFADVHRGDIVVLRYPLDPSLDYIKRVVGLPGDEIVISGASIWVNDELLDEPYVAPEAIDPTTHMKTTVKVGHYFVLGDNRIRSSDSREFGEVPFEYLRGKVRLRLWPLERAGLID